MHKLARQVRFSINPFLPEDNAGFNPFASKPAGEGLSIFLDLSIGLVGEVKPDTGFVVNVSDIDRCVRRYVVPIFAGRIREYFRQSKHIGFPTITELLKSSWQALADKFGTAKLSELCLNLNPFRKMAVDCKDCKMIYFSEKFEFAATHKLWNDDFSRQRNLEVFGKCANPTGHGHNYIVEVTAKTPAAPHQNQAQQSISKVDNNSNINKPDFGAGFNIGEFERIVDDQLIKLLDHKNLNIDVAEFSKANPTVENIALFAWNKLAPLLGGTGQASKFGKAELHCVTVWETDKTSCSYYGPRTHLENQG